MYFFSIPQVRWYCKTRSKYLTWVSKTRVKIVLSEKRVVQRLGSYIYIHILPSTVLEYYDRETLTTCGAQSLVSEIKPCDDQQIKVRKSYYTYVITNIGT